MRAHRCVDGIKVEVLATDIITNCWQRDA